MATVRDIHDIREIFIAATGRAYINAGHVFDQILDQYVDKMNGMDARIYTQEDLDDAVVEAYDEGYYDGKEAAKDG